MLVPIIGQLSIVSGPSGVGKDSAVKRVLKANPNLQKSLSYTTREPRGKEVDGEHYRFVSAKEFAAMRARNEFLEWKRVHGNYYGTSLLRTQQLLGEGKSIVLVIDVRGAIEVMTQYQTLNVFLMPPSFAELKQRLRGRDEDTDEAIQRRLRASLEEVRSADRFTNVIYAEDREKTAHNLSRVLKGEYLGKPPDLCERIKRFVLDSSP